MLSRRSGRTGRWAAAALLGAVSALGCSSLPGYAQPQGGLVDPDSFDRSNLVTYRQLERADFTAEQPPAEQAAHAKQLGALTCSYITTTPETGFQAQETIDPDGSSSFVAQLKKVGFVAYMDRACSWWNDEQPAESEEYTLQHEQIHFALSELAARALNERVPRLLEEVRAEGSSLDEVSASMNEQLQDLVLNANEELLARNLDFDEDTSGKVDPVAQQKWHDEVHAELRASER